MSLDDAKIKIKGKILHLARDSGKNYTSLAEDDVIPTSGILDSASIMMLILWYENEFGVSTDEEDLTIDNFGTVNLMADYLARHR